MYTVNDPLASFGYVIISYEKYVKEAKDNSQKPVSFFKFCFGKY